MKQPMLPTALQKQTLPCNAILMYPLIESKSRSFLPVNPQRAESITDLSARGEPVRLCKFQLFLLMSMNSNLDWWLWSLKPDRAPKAR